MKQYFIAYKPYLVLSQFSAKEDKKTLGDFFHLPQDVYNVGRLDEDSEGLLLFTNDKKLNHRLLDPSFEHEREYWVQVEGAITNEALEQLQHGVTINVQGNYIKTKPAKVFLFKEDPLVPQRNPPVRFRKSIPTSWISLTLREGKNRQVRKMTAKTGFPTLRLIRYRIEKVTLQQLQPGEVIQLDPKSIYGKLGINFR